MRYGTYGKVYQVFTVIESDDLHVFRQGVFLYIGYFIF